MERTAAERQKDDRESVNSNLQALGAGGALRYSAKQLAENPPVHVRRMCILTIRAAAKQLRLEINSATRLARCHASGLRSIGVKVALLLVVAAPAASQSVVYTNVVNGRPQHEIVRVVRAVQPAAALPTSMQESTPVLPRNYKRPLGPTYYVPTVRAAAASVVPVKQPQPWFINGIYAGPSPNWNWMSTSIGRPIVDVRIIDTPRRPR